MSFSSISDIYAVGVGWGGGGGWGAFVNAAVTVLTNNAGVFIVAAGTVLVNTDCILADFGASGDSGLVSGQISDWSSKSGLYLTCPFCVLLLCSMQDSSAYCKQTSCSWNLIHLFQHLFCVTVLHFGEGDSDY